MVKVVAHIPNMRVRPVEFDATPYFDQAPLKHIQDMLADKGDVSWTRMEIVRHMHDRPGYEALSELYDESLGHSETLSLKIDPADLKALVARRTGSDLAAMFDEAAERVGRSYETSMLSRSHFHLSACGGCGAPSFSQPCAICGFYPMGAPTAADRRDPTSREKFVKAVEASYPHGKGNLATWYLSSYRKTVAYAQGDAYKDRVERAVESAAWLKDLPDAGAVFDHVSAGGRIRRPQVSLESTTLWSVMHELDSAVIKGQEGVESGRDLEFVREMTNQVREAKRIALDAIHGGSEWDEAVDALDNALDSFLDRRATMRWIPSGNLIYASHSLDAVREKLQEAGGPRP